MSTLLWPFGALAVLLFVAVSSLSYFAARILRCLWLARYQELIRSHREIWRLTLETPDFKRILADCPGIDEDPPSYHEVRFVNFVILHMTTAFYLARSGHGPEMERFTMDARQFVALPLPSAVWQSQREYMSDDFVRFIEGGAPE